MADVNVAAGDCQGEIRAALYLAQLASDAEDGLVRHRGGALSNRRSFNGGTETSAAMDAPSTAGEGPIALCTRCFNVSARESGGEGIGSEDVSLAVVERVRGRVVVQVPSRGSGVVVSGCASSFGCARRGRIPGGRPTKLLRPPQHQTPSRS